MIAIGLTAWKGLAEVVTFRVTRSKQGVRMGGVHGGNMGRSVSRFSMLIGSAVAVGSLIAGCASNAPGGAVIGVPAAAPSVAPQPTGNFLAGLEQAVANELSAINSTQTDNEPPQVLIELNALTSESALLQSETFSSLVATGTNQIVKRERLLNALTIDVKGSAYLTGVEVNGTSVETAILAMINRVDGQLQSQASSIASASLIDVLRGVITSIGPSTRVLGLVEPAVHLAIAGGDELNGVNILQGQYNKLFTEVSHFKRSSGYSEESQRLANLAQQIAIVGSAASADVRAVLALTPAGYPGNKATILNVRAQLTQFRSPLGQLNTAAGDVAEIEFLLSQR